MTGTMGVMERPQRSMTHRYVVEQRFHGVWREFTFCTDLADGQRIISEFDHIASARPSRVVRVSTATERQVVG